MNPGSVGISTDIKICAWKDDALVKLVMIPVSTVFRDAILH